MLIKIRYKYQKINQNQLKNNFKIIKMKKNKKLFNYKNKLINFIIKLLHQNQKISILNYLISAQDDIS